MPAPEVTGIESNEASDEGRVSPIFFVDFMKQKLWFSLIHCTQLAPESADEMSSSVTPVLISTKSLLILARLSWIIDYELCNCSINVSPVTVS